MPRINYEGLTKSQFFLDFNHDSIESLSKSCSKNIDMIVADVPNGISDKNAAVGTIDGNYPVFTVVMVIYHYVERIWRILVTPNLLYNIYNHE